MRAHAERCRRPSARPSCIYDHVQIGYAAQNRPSAASQLDGGVIVRLRATCCLTCCAGLLFAGAWCTMQSGRIARSAPEFAGTQLDKLYGIRCPRPPTLALPERSCSRTDCSCPLLTQALDRQTPRRPAPRPQSSLASAIPTDAAETAVPPRRIASHCTASRPAWHGR